MLSRIVVLLSMVFFVALPGLRGQVYSTCLGLRWGEGMGITVRQKLMKKISIEGLYYHANNKDHSLAGAIIDHHMPLLTKRMNLYAGAGYGILMPGEGEVALLQQHSFLINTGLELTLGRLNVSWDFMPVIALSKGQVQAPLPLSAFSLRYVIIKKEKESLLKDIFGEKKKKKRKQNAKHKKPAQRKISKKN